MISYFYFIYRTIIQILVFIFLIPRFLLRISNLPGLQINWRISRVATYLSSKYSMKKKLEKKYFPNLDIYKDL